MKKNGKVYHIIDSIKGGCGKTTFSIMFAEYLNTCEPENSNRRSVLLDMDFLGTGLFNIFYHNIGSDNFEEARKEFLNSNCFINDRIRGVDNVYGKKYITKLQVEGKEFYIAFGNPSYDVKEDYLQATKNGFSMGLKFGTIRAGLRKMLDNNELEKQLPFIPRHIIVDLAPCNDSYSQAAKDVFFDRDESKIITKEDTINYYLMSGLDSSHLYNVCSYLRNILNRADKMPNNIFIILNDIRYRNSKDTKEIESEEEVYDYIFDYIEKFLVNIPEDRFNSIHFLALNYYKNYQDFLMKLEPLINVKEKEPGSENSIFEHNPFRFCREKGKTIQVINDAEKKVLEWIQ